MKINLPFLSLFDFGILLFNYSPTINYKISKIIYREKHVLSAKKHTEEFFFFFYNNKYRFVKLPQNGAIFNTACFKLAADGLRFILKIKSLKLLSTIIGNK